MNSPEPKEQPPVVRPAAEEHPRFKTMHDNLESWTDTCSCEPEPRWQALADELERLKSAQVDKE
jgi:hypothetical protein